MWMRIDGATATLGFDNMISYGRPITGTTGWLLYNVVLDVPADAVGVTIGALFEGRKLVRIDDVKFEIVATTDAATVAWLGANARPFVTDAPTSGFDDLAEIGTIVGTARVVALGEATHGTREFFRMKHRTFEYLVEKQGFTHFTIKATMPKSRSMDTERARRCRRRPRGMRADCGGVRHRHSMRAGTSRGYVPAVRFATRAAFSTWAQSCNGRLDVTIVDTFHTGSSALASVHFRLARGVCAKRGRQ